MTLSENTQVDAPTVPTRPAVRIGRVSMVRRPMMLVVTAAMALVLFLVFCLGIGRGDYPLSVPQVVDVLLGGGTRIQNFVVLDLRLPRSLTGLLVGAALGLSGAVTQSVSRNALASPDLLGITAGGSAAAVALIVLGGGGTLVGILATLGLPLAALIGSLLAAIAIYSLSWNGGVSGFRLILVGIGVNAILIALIGWMLVSADITDVARAQVWLTGSLGATTWAQVWPILVTVLVVGAALVVGSTRLTVLRLGDDNARALGLGLQRNQAGFLFAAVVLAAAATAVAGPVGFVALAAPQVALRLLRTAGPPLLGSALCGAILVLFADFVGRTILPVELPVGIVTSALGGPFLLYLLVRSNRKVSA